MRDLRPALTRVGVAENGLARTAVPDVQEAHWYRRRVWRYRCPCAVAVHRAARRRALELEKQRLRNGGGV